MLEAQIKREAQKAYSEWLSTEKWDLFLTLTDPGLSHPEAMYKRTRHWMNLVNRDLYGRNYWKRTQGIEWVVGLERQTRGSVHSHSLIRIPTHDVKDVAQFSLRHWQKVAQELGGHAWLELPTNSERTVNYVTKYVCKDGEIYFSDSLDPSNPKAYSHTLIGAQNGN
jgi:hypothetical protein